MLFLFDDDEKKYINFETNNYGCIYLLDFFLFLFKYNDDL